MKANLREVNIAILGGDEREKYLIQELLALEAKVKVVGKPGLTGNHSLIILDNPKEAIKGSQVIIAPMTGTDEEGKLKSTFSPYPLYLSEELFQEIPSQTLFFIGTANNKIKELATSQGIKLLETANINELAILNAIPTAEGAIQIAMEKLPITIHGSQSLVLGLGRVGLALARMLDGIGAKVTVASRDLGELARAKEMGLSTIYLSNLEDTIRQYQIIFNTIPALVLEERILSKANPDVLIIDLASKPEGTDFTAAKHLGLQAMLAPGLPGKVAPKTAGRILGEIIPQVIRANLGRCLK